MPRFKLCISMALHRSLDCKYVMELSALYDQWFNKKTGTFSKEKEKLVEQKINEKTTEVAGDCIASTNIFSGICATLFNDQLISIWKRAFDYKEKICKEKNKAILKQAKRKPTRVS